MTLKINEVAKLSGLTVRTLHYYDEIGLLHPTTTSSAGYRLYDEVALTRLQQILFFKELDFPLNQIKEIMMSPEFDSQEALLNHKVLLIKKRERLNKLINLIDKTIEGELDMNFKAFDTTDFEATKNKYAKEVQSRWGDSNAYKESEKKTASYDKKEWDSVLTQGNEIMKEFAESMDRDVTSDEVQSLVKKWQDHITSSFYTCTKEILAGLGLMYVEDERFKNNIDQHREGLAQFISDAIKVYCEN